MNDLELLERHKPVLMFDPQYDYRTLAAGSALANPGNLLLRDHGELIARSTDAKPLELDALTAYDDPDPGDFLALAAGQAGDASRMEWEEPHRGRLYGRVERDTDGKRTWLQYWFWLYYNPKHLFGFGKHEGDWEMVQIGLDERLEPKEASYAQHNSGETRRWREKSMCFKKDDPNRPLVFVAPLSHASYFEPGTHPYFFGVDDPRDDGPPADNLSLVEFGDWARWPGRWGNPERAFLGRLGNGPNSPGHQGAKWDNPGDWHKSLRTRKLRVWVGRAVHRLGFLTYPHQPATLRARLDGGRVEIEWELSRRRRGRHLYVTLHQDHLVLNSRRIRGAGRKDETSLLVPDGRQPTAVTASVYNRLRQRSDPQSVPIA
ncbi:MAG: hypothetical protein ACRDN8_01105 [Thermoleophilaceae bacterium]